jgi:hypothetical protein
MDGIWVNGQTRIHVDQNEQGRKRHGDEMCDDNDDATDTYIVRSERNRQ